MSQCHRWTDDVLSSSEKASTMSSYSCPSVYICHLGSSTFFLKRFTGFSEWFMGGDCLITLIISLWSLHHTLNCMVLLKSSTPSSQISVSQSRRKDEFGTLINHLGFLFDFNLIKVRLPPNKHAHATQAVSNLALRKIITQALFKDTLGFLSHCCQVISLSHLFLHQLYSLLKGRSQYYCIHLNYKVKQDLRWWKLFLSSWSVISLIYLSHSVFNISTDAGSLKGIRDLYDGRISPWGSCPGTKKSLPTGNKCLWFYIR